MNEELTPEQQAEHARSIYESMNEPVAPSQTDTHTDETLSLNQADEAPGVVVIEDPINPVVGISHMNDGTPVGHRSDGSTFTHDGVNVHVSMPVTTPQQETKAEKFKRVGTNKLRTCVTSIRGLSYLADGRYEYTDEQIENLLNTLRCEISDIEATFFDSKKSIENIEL